MWRLQDLIPSSHRYHHPTACRGCPERKNGPLFHRKIVHYSTGKWSIIPPENGPRFPGNGPSSSGNGPFSSRSMVNFHPEIVHSSAGKWTTLPGKWSIIPPENGQLFRRKMVHYSRSAHTGLSGWLGNRSSIKLTPFGCSSDAAKSKVFACVIISSVSPMPRVPLPPDRIRD